jgi:undecaprenyl-diphosphatase
MFYRNIKLLFDPKNVMYASIVGSLFLIISEIFRPKKHTTSHIKKINLLQSLFIGLFQTLCLCPGFSRSGATIAAGILLGLKRSVAIEFSFIISIPLLLGSSFLDIVHNIKNITISDYPILCTELVTSFLVSHVLIKKLLKIINNTSLIFFGIYRLIIAMIIYFIN